MLTRKLFRTAWSYKAQFISMILMITLGMGMFLGFNMEWKTIEVDTFRFFDQTNYADYRLYSEKGFPADDLDKIEGIEGVDAATRYLSVNLDIKGEKNKSLALDVSENYTVSTFTVMDGEAYDENTVIEHTFSHQAAQYYGSIISTIIIAISLFAFDWRMALASVWVLPVSLLAVRLSKRTQNRFNKSKNDTRVRLEDGVQEAIETLRDLKSNNAETEYIDGLDDIIKDYEKKSIAAELGVAAFIVPAQMFLKFGIATTALVGSALLLGGQITVITFFMFLLVVSRLYEPMAGTLINLGALNSAQVNIDRTNAMNDIKKQEGKQDFKPERFDIEFKNVGFEYNDDETVLSDVSFTAKQGEVTALIGPSGGGKTTVSRLAARFWDVTKGRITFGGEDIATIDPEELLNYYSIVFQDVTLFNNTIMENIRIGKKDATDEEVMNAARLANCDEFISRLPDGYNTVIGENGAKLSGGERQRISIARAFLKDAPVILLDEATASLDAENETLIQQSLSRLIKNKTVMIIAHRMRTIAGADKIVVIKDGKSDEQGTPGELKQQNGFYTRMLSLQTKG